VKIVLDTNVILAGMATRGVCEALIRICTASPQHIVLLSEPILDEFADHYQHIFGMSSDQTKSVVRLLRESAIVVKPVVVDKEACRDPDDLLVLGTALAGNANCIISGDNDLLVLRYFKGIPILSPRVAYDQLRE
jgi:putative PIN family toxin of toxin-antitoxin system